MFLGAIIQIDILIRLIEAIYCHYLPDVCVAGGEASAEWDSPALYQVRAPLGREKGTMTSAATATRVPNSETARSSF